MKMNKVKIALLIVIFETLTCASFKNSFLNDIENDNNEALYLEINLSPAELFNYTTSVLRLSYYKNREDKNILLFLEKNNQNITIPEKIKFKCENFSLVKEITNPESHYTGIERNKYISEHFRLLISFKELKEIGQSEKCEIIIYGKISSDDFYIDKNGLKLINKLTSYIETKFK
ncbi:hypothetical protein EHQ79_14970 [Leptospira jelokensis]|nr:hypothetical protein EHQ79_14970 [Leptospira jelokensis]